MGDCVLNCPDGTFKVDSDRVTGRRVRRCDKCHITCKSCKSSSMMACLSCHQESLFAYGQCVSHCKERWVLTSIRKASYPQSLIFPKILFLIFLYLLSSRFYSASVVCHRIFKIIFFLSNSYFHFFTPQRVQAGRQVSQMSPQLSEVQRRWRVSLHRLLH